MKLKKTAVPKSKSKPNPKIFKMVKTEKSIAYKDKMKKASRIKNPKKQYNTINLNRIVNRFLGIIFITF